jgi:hypothetical protein
METGDAICRIPGRRKDVRASTLAGLDFVEVVSEDQTSLEAFFLGEAPSSLSAANIVISGGRAVHVTSMRLHRVTDPTLDDWMELTVDRAGDFATYRLALMQLDATGRPTDKPLSGMDPRYASVEFSFKASCPTDLDCQTQPACPPTAPVSPDINYLAKDYSSFRQMLLDRLAVTMPDWQEMHIPDIGIMLVELLAYVGDQLSYYQDAVATEAYLATARQRISLRRHARLVDYALHEGCNARAWVAINAVSDTPLPAGAFWFCTALPGVAGGGVLQPADLTPVAAAEIVPFEPLLPDPTQAFPLYVAHNTIPFYAWGDCACCLPIGTTRTTLLDHWVTPPGNGTAGQRAMNLKPGDILIFEEVIGPGTGNPADADPRHRQAVRLTSVTPTTDPLYDRDTGGRPVVEICWCPDDALTFPLCLSAVMPAPDCSCREGISVARGNVLLVDHGLHASKTFDAVPVKQTTETCPTECSPPGVIITPRRFCPQLSDTPLTYAQALPPCGCASALAMQDPRQAMPWISLTGTVQTAAGPVNTTWTVEPDLLESGPLDRNFVVEIDNAGMAHLRFGNGDEGMQPAAGTVFEAAYRLGNGTAGNVGAETIVHLVFRSTQEGFDGTSVRNLLPVSGGTAPETLANVRALAPHMFRDVIERAVTAGDYAALAADNARRLAERPTLMTAAAAVTPMPLPPPADPRAGEEEEPGERAPLPADLCRFPFRGLQAARGALRWTGSWYEADVVADPFGGVPADTELCAEVAAYLEPYRRISHDLAVGPARYVPLDVGLSICVTPGWLRGQVEAALLSVLGAGWRADGTPALFNPANVGFGQGVYASPIIAAAQAVNGVVDVQLTRLARLLPGSAPPGVTPDQVPASGLLQLGRFEIAQLTPTLRAPGQGRLTLILRGGR